MPTWSLVFLLLESPGRLATFRKTRESQPLARAIGIIMVCALRMSALVMVNVTVLFTCVGPVLVTVLTGSLKAHHLSCYTAAVKPISHKRNHHGQKVIC